MCKDSLVAWSQFETMMRTGVPHAMDIAAELVRYDLQVPLPTQMHKPQIDLQFYCVIHRAYRAEVLSKFLSIMELLKETSLWSGIQCSQETQLWIVQLCQAFNKLPLTEAAKLIVAELSNPDAQSKSVA